MHELFILNSTFFKIHIGFGGGGGGEIAFLHNYAQPINEGRKEENPLCKIMP
jgi:hypothetical protein